jgi:hypothetical protein
VGVDARLYRVQRRRHARGEGAPRAVFSPLRAGAGVGFNMPI